MASRRTTISIVALAAVAAVGCGGGDSDSKSDSKPRSPKAESKLVASGAVAVKPNGKTVVKLRSNGIVMGSTAGSRRTGDEVSMAAISGEMVSATAIGFVRTGGGVVFQRGNAKVPFTDIVVSTRKRSVTATNNGRRMILFQLRVANIKRTSTSKGAIRASGLGVSLTGKAAALINRGLGVNVFSKRMPFGTVVIAVSLKKKGEAASAKPGASTAKPSTAKPSTGKTTSTTTTESK